MDVHPKITATPDISSAPSRPTAATYDKGWTLRDEIALRFAVAIVPTVGTTGSDGGYSTQYEWMRWAYMDADAFLAERARHQ